MRTATFLSGLFSGIAYALLLSTASSLSYGADPLGVSPPSGKKWTMTFDDEFTRDKSIDTRKWNGGASNTNWCATGGAYMFREPTDDQCVDSYSGLTLNSTNGLEMRSPGYPSAAIQTGGTTPENAKFIQKFGYWEARIKQPHSTNGEGKGIHPDFWMHPIPEGPAWLPEINVGERPSWDASLESANNKMSFSVNEKNDHANYGPGTHGYYGTSPLTDLSADWHTYGLYWRDDSSGPYGSVQFYLDGVPVSSPYTLSSKDTNMANGVYIFFSLDNDQKGGSSSNPFMIQYVRVWRLDTNKRSNSSSSGSSGGARTLCGKRQRPGLWLISARTKGRE